MDQEETQKLIGSIVDAVRTDQNALSQSAKRSRALKDIGATVLFFSALIAAGAVTVKELQEKPTLREVQDHVEEVIEPVREKVQEVDVMKADTKAIKKDIGRMKQVQDYQLEQSAWQGDVLEHMANKKKGKPPGKPSSLNEKERELLQ